MSIAIASDAPMGITHEQRLQRALAGDEGAFAWIVETFSSDMAQVCLVVVGDLELADEAVAAAWPIAWRTLGRLRDPERLRSWLISIAANQARQMARARRRRMVREIALPPTDQPAHSRDRDSEIDLKNALARLSPDDRALLALRYVAGFDSNELAVQRAFHLPARGRSWPASLTRCEGNLAMTETIAFEDRIAEQLRGYAAPAARPPRREAVANAVEAARNVHGGIRGGLRWPRLGRPSMAFAAGAAVVVLAVVGVVFLGSLPNQPRLGGPAVTPTVTPMPTAQPSISGSMWPQSSTEEVRRAQERADAGDPDYTWQVDPQLVGGPTDGWDEHLIETGVQVTERFLRDELGWDAFMFNPEQGFGDDGGIDGIIRNLVYLRCAPGEANSLYPIAGDEGASGAERCAPTIDDLRYETVSIDLSQPVRRGADGIWVVNRWNIATPFAQADPKVVQAEAEARLESFSRLGSTAREPRATSMARCRSSMRRPPAHRTRASRSSAWADRSGHAGTLSSRSGCSRRTARPLSSRRSAQTAERWGLTGC